MKVFDVDQRLAMRMAKVLQKEAVRRDGDDPTGTLTKKWTRRLLRGLESHPALRMSLFEGGMETGIRETLAELEKRSSRHGQRVTAIERQHRANLAGSTADGLEYSEASAYMGEEWWMRTAHADVIKRIDEYFLLSPDAVRLGHHPWAFKSGGLPEGWKRYTVASREMFWNPKTKKMQSQVPTLAAEVTPPPPREPPLAMLDVGSCANPFLRWPFYVKPVALDLQPKPDCGVLKADFFKVPIVELEAHEEQVEHILLGDDGQLEGIVAGSFDIVILSLVLSYVPEPERRMEMVARARRCLREDRGLLFIIEVASALPNSDNRYQADAAAEWSRAIEEAGFRTKRFEDHVADHYPPKFHALLQWVFETAPLQDGPLKPLLTPKDMA